MYSYGWLSTSIKKKTAKRSVKACVNETIIIWQEVSYHIYWSDFLDWWRIVRHHNRPICQSLDQDLLRGKKWVRRWVVQSSHLVHWLKFHLEVIYLVMHYWCQYRWRPSKAIELDLELFDFWDFWYPIIAPMKGLIITIRHEYGMSWRWNTLVMVGQSIGQHW